MDCVQAQNDLLSAESLNLLAPELSAHLAECPQCQTLLAKLRKLEAETIALPVPTGHEQPSAEFLRTLIAAAAETRRSIHPLFRRAMAAAIVVIVGLIAVSLIFFNGSSVQADVLIGDLVNWNLSIAHVHDAGARRSAYQSQLQQLQTEAGKAKLDSSEQALVQKLMDNARWLTTEDDSTAESQRFHALADELLTHRQSANNSAAQHYQQMYDQVMSQGVNSGSTPSSAPAATLQNTDSTSFSSYQVAAEFSHSSRNYAREFFASAATVESTPSVTATPARNEYSWASNNSDDYYPGYISHPSSAYNAGSFHDEGSRSHHSSSHGGGETVTTGSDSSHPAASSTTGTNTNNTTTASSQTHSATDASTHTNTSVASSATIHPLISSTPLVSTQLPLAPCKTWDSNSQSSGRPSLASLKDLSGIESIPVQLLPNLPSPGQIAFDLSNPASIPVVLTQAPSRRDIDQLLAQHIDHDAESGFDWPIGQPPPGLAPSQTYFFGGHDFDIDHDHDDDDGGPAMSFIAPTAFPEPAMGLILLVPCLLRRRRR